MCSSDKLARVCPLRVCVCMRHLRHATMPHALEPPWLSCWCCCASTRHGRMHSLGPIDRGLDLSALLADMCGTAVGHWHTHWQHGTHAATRRVCPGLDRCDQLGPRVHDVRPLEEDLLDAHVPIARDAAWVREADGPRRRHQGDV